MLYEFYTRTKGFRLKFWLTHEVTWKHWFNIFSLRLTSFPFKRINAHNTCKSSKETTMFTRNPENIAICCNLNRWSWFLYHDKILQLSSMCATTCHVLLNQENLLGDFPWIFSGRCVNRGVDWTLYWWCCRGRCQTYYHGQVQAYDPFCDCWGWRRIPMCSGHQATGGGLSSGFR